MNAPGSAPTATLRRRVSLGGRVVDPCRRLGKGARVTLVASAAPAAARQATGGRTRQADVRADGRYFFIDLPAGAFVVSVNAGSGPVLAERPVRLGAPGSDSKVNYALQVAFDLEIPPVAAGPSVARSPTPSTTHVSR